MLVNANMIYVIKNPDKNSYRDFNNNSNYLFIYLKPHV